MTKFWNKDSYAGKFELFSMPHILTLAVIIVVIFLVYLFRKKIKDNKRLDIYLRSILVVVMLVAEISSYYWAYSNGVFNIGDSLPLTLCGMNVYLIAILLYNKNYSLYEVLFFMVSLGSLQALITPDVGYAFPHIRYIQFFTTHGCVLISIFYITFIYNYRPRLISILKTYIALILYAILIWIVNSFIGGNYLYLAHKPESVSLLDYLGPWPWYIVIMAMSILPYFLLIYFLFCIVGFVKSKLNKQLKNV
ncbi:conserved hypothetical integral membrane protein TIGR02206 [Clostridium cavendishii DSM 21758]|uniref:Conserved hypothetical integral membrane protein TIGR02206 n=1 Tax=Clostridium cavendishii DSM 21758 TaxID=1121302 RepID=A0A1M6DM80_9CLOT|nr:TIGR02206 family membrane protein [Clostridium cavendishii]SHI74295.1 conserved hypothetical integral membrane protein TIGR02206 [Clostridium cavendishii DSM 21758]